MCTDTISIHIIALHQTYGYHSRVMPPQIIKRDSASFVSQHKAPSVRKLSLPHSNMLKIYFFVKMISVSLRRSIPDLRTKLRDFLVVSFAPKLKAMQETSV